MKKSNSHKPKINIIDFFDDATINRAGLLYEKLEKELITGRETGLSDRNITYWTKVLNLNPNKIFHRKYTMVEFIWLKIVEQLRGLNVEFELILLFQKSILEPIEIEGLLTHSEQIIEYLEAMKVSNEQKQTIKKIITATNKQNFKQVKFYDTPFNSN
jgi:DNA-binding transcriptional MerR regulator